MLPFLFSAMTMSSVSRAAYQMIEEVRRQFKTMPGIMKGTEKPDYKSCVAISTTAALKEMLVPGVMAVLAPLVVGILLGPSALGGLLAGALVTGVMMAIFMSNAGGAWDNAKKYIEDGNHGGKGSEAHKAAVVGDTVGDPFKDTSGPSINILIKLMTVVSLVFAPLFLSIGMVVIGRKHKNGKEVSVPKCTDISFPFYVFLEEFLWMIYRKLRKIIELRDWQPPAVCDNICVGTFINV